MELTNIAAAVIYSAVSKNDATYVLLSAGLAAAIYLIYRTSFERLEVKTREAEALGRLHLSYVPGQVCSQTRASHRDIRPLRESL